MIGPAHVNESPLSAFGKSWVRSRAGRLTGTRRGGARFQKKEFVVTEAAATQPNPMISPLVMGQAVVIHTVHSCGSCSPTLPIMEDCLLPDAALKDDFVGLTVDIVAAYVSNNSVSSTEVRALISDVYKAVAALGKAPGVIAAPPKPAVAVRGSVKPAYLVCLEDGGRVKMLKRYLSTRYNLTPAEYRTKWSLPPDYPMVAPSYAERRRELAHSIGLGRKRKPVAELATPIPEPKSEMKAAVLPKAPRRKLKIATKS